MLSRRVAPTLRTQPRCFPYLPLECSRWIEIVRIQQVCFASATGSTSFYRLMSSF